MKLLLLLPCLFLACCNGTKPLHVCQTKDPIVEPGPKRAWADNSNVWKYSHTVANDKPGNIVLTVEPHSYITPHTWARIQLYANGWKVPNGLTFKFNSKKKGSLVGPSPSKSDIRVSVGAPVGGGWSYVGNNCRLISQSKSTMHLGVNAAGTNLMDIAHHEFGHGAVGLSHEHQNPLAGIPWNTEQVYKDTAEWGWSKEETDRNIINKPTTTNFSTSGYNPESVMGYSYPGSWRLDGVSVEWTPYIHESDLALVRQLYP